jgi:hypothetical protein
MHLTANDHDHAAGLMFSEGNVKIVVTKGIYTPRTPPPPFFAGIPIWVKYFLRFFWGIEPTTPTPHAEPATLPRHFGLPSLVPPCYINQNPEVAGETDRQLAKNVPIDMNQTVKQVPNTPPGGGDTPAQVGFEPGRSKFPKFAGVLRCSTRVLQRSAEAG